MRFFVPGEIEYSTRQDDFCLQLMLQTAAYLLAWNPGLKIFFDGRPFSRRYQIENVLTASASLHQPWRIVECICSDETVKQRLEADAKTGNHRAGNRDYQLYLEVKVRFETITHPKIVIHTDQPLEVCIEQALQ